MRPDVGHLLPVDDGYTFDGFIRAVPGAFPDFRFSYRPATVAERSRTLKALRGKSEEEYHEIMASVIAQKLKKWSCAYPADATDSSGESLAGQEVPITDETVLQLKWAVLLALEEIVVLGERASDVDPLWPTEDGDSLKAAKAEAAKTGRPIGQVILEGAAKNSQKGSN